MPQKVFVVCKGIHDYSDAKEFGELVFLSEEKIDKIQTSNITRRFEKILSDSNKDDYILLSGLTVVNSIACAVFAHRHGQLNLLIFRGGKKAGKNLYFAREIVFQTKGDC